MKEKSMNIKEMGAEVVAVFDGYDKTGTKHWTYEIAAKDLMYQVGSLMKLVMQMDGERFAHGKTSSELKSAIADEVADIIADTLFLAHELDIDVEQAWNGMRKSDQKKINERSK